MTSNVSFERELRTFLDDKAGQQMPDYAAEVLLRTAILPQRKRWSSPGLLLDIDSIRARVSTPPLGTLRLMLAALIVLALVGALIAGALLRRQVPPFGPAGNGLIAIANPSSIVTVDPDGSNLRTFVEAPDGVEDLRWSPDGSRLAFKTLSPMSRKPAVMVVDRDGSHLTDVTPGFSIGGYDQAVSWSPDSSRLVIPSPETEPGGLIVANADGSGARALELDVDPHTVVSAAWSPDGAWIAFGGLDVATGGLGLYLVRPDGSGEQLVGSLGSDSQGGPPEWAPDPELRRLVFVEATGAMVVHDVAANRSDRIAPSGNWPAWSPDAAMVAWWDDGILLGDVNALVAGGEPRALVSSTANCPTRGVPASSTPCGPPTWSPDGKWIVTTDVSGKAVITVRVDGSQPPITTLLPPGTELNPIGSATWQRIAPSP